MKERPLLQNNPRSLRIKQGQRKQLPVLQPARDDYSIWDIIKPNLGKDFSRFAVPVWLNEPISFLQRLAEVMQYAELLETAAAQSDPVDRIAHIGAFVVSALSPNFCRLSKPFNPLLLETYEMERDGYKFVAEQVSHHPPVSAIYAEGPSFVIEATVCPKISFGFNKLICHPGATYKLTLKTTGEEYLYDGPTCSIYNVMLGKMYMNITGTATMRCVQTGLSMVLSFDSGKGWHFKTLDVHVDGHIMQGKTKLRAIYGNWTYFLAQCGVDTFKNNHSQYQQMFKDSLEPHTMKTNVVPVFHDTKVLWTAAQPLQDMDKQFRFTYFSLTLNELTPELARRLPPTDSRFREDMRAYEQGKLEEAEEHKHELEEAQRKRRKEGTGNCPRWFELDGDRWVFTGAYWDRDWSESTDIFLLK